MQINLKANKESAKNREKERKKRHRKERCEFRAKWKQLNIHIFKFYIQFRLNKSFDPWWYK